MHGQGYERAASYVSVVVARHERKKRHKHITTLKRYISLRRAKRMLEQTHIPTVKARSAAG